MIEGEKVEWFVGECVEIWRKDVSRLGRIYMDDTEASRALDG